jgi:resolvase-like protein
MGGRTTTRQRSNAPTRAAVYHRVSSDEQVEGYSLDAEMRATRAYSEGEAWEIVQVYADEGRSARTDDFAKRPAFAHMLDNADPGRFDLIVVHKLTASPATARSPSRRSSALAAPASAFSRLRRTWTTRVRPGN